METIGKMVVTAVIVPLFIWLCVWCSAFSYGYVATQFYEWFVAGIFPSFPKLGIYEYAGLFCFVGLFNGKKVEMWKIKKEYLIDTTWEKFRPITLFLLAPWTAYAGGYILQYWIK